MFFRLSPTMAVLFSHPSRILIFQSAGLIVVHPLGSVDLRRTYRRIILVLHHHDSVHYKKKYQFITYSTDPTQPNRK